MIKLNFHSVVDVITNSSTVIYTYQNGSEAPAKELVNEILRLSGIEDKRAEDIFHYMVMADISDVTYDIKDEYEQYSNMSYDDIIKMFENDMLKVLNGEISEPDYFRMLKSNGDIQSNTYLYLIPKDEKYEVLGEKIVKLLNSVDAEEGYGG